MWWSSGRKGPTGSTTASATAARATAGWSYDSHREELIRGGAGHRREDVVSHLVDSLASLPAPLVLLVVGTFALLEGAVLAGLILPGEAVIVLGASLAPAGGRSVLLVWVVAAAGSIT